LICLLASIQRQGVNVPNVGGGKKGTKSGGDGPVGARGNLVGSRQNYSMMI
jgi:hypothetical protein